MRTTSLNKLILGCGHWRPGASGQQQQHGGGVEQQRHDQDEVVHGGFVGAADERRERTAGRPRGPSARRPRWPWQPADWPAPWLPWYERRARRSSILLFLIGVVDLDQKAAA